MAFQPLHQAMDADLRVTPHESMHRIGPDRHLQEFLSPPFNLLGKNRLESLI
jgi:hypothetical protein